jgi:putative membrane protein
MRRRALSVAAIAALVTLAACGGERRIETVDCRKFNATGGEEYDRISGRAGALTDEDRQFICHAAIGESAGVVLARMAARRAAGPAVRDYAQRMAYDHAKTHEEIAALARGEAGIAAPAGLDAAHLAQRDALAGLSGPAFDSAYLRASLDQGTKLIGVYQNEIKNGGSPTFRRFAADNLEVLQERLRMTQSVGGQTTF